MWLYVFLKYSAHRALGSKGDKARTERPRVASLLAMATVASPQRTAYEGHVVGSMCCKPMEILFYS